MTAKKVSNSKIVDIKGKMVNYGRWNGVLLFWGFKACKLVSGGDNQPFKWCPPRFILCRGDSDYTRGSSELKVAVAVLTSSSLNSLTSNEGVHLDKINPFDQLLPSSLKQLVWAVAIYFPRLVCLTTVKGVIL